jgi:hypothetical protein
MNLTTPILRQPANHQLVGHLANIGCRGPSFLRKTVGVDPEICSCGARMIVDDAITDGKKFTETLARLRIVSTGPPRRRQSTSELDYVCDV